jgi:hypothetical protein
MAGEKISCCKSDEYLREDLYKPVGLICSFLLFFYTKTRMGRPAAKAACGLCDGQEKRLFPLPDLRDKTK